MELVDYKRVDYTINIDGGHRATVVSINSQIRSYDKNVDLFVFKLVSTLGLAIDLTGADIDILLRYRDNNGNYAAPFYDKGSVFSVTDQQVSYRLNDMLRGQVGTVEMTVGIKLKSGEVMDISDLSFSLVQSQLDRSAGDLWDPYSKRLEEIEAALMGQASTIVPELNEAIDQTVKDYAELKKTLKLSQAWSWSADGTDRFTTVKPGENFFAGVGYHGVLSIKNTPSTYFIGVNTLEQWGYTIPIKRNQYYRFRAKIVVKSTNATDLSISLGYANARGKFILGDQNFAHPTDPGTYFLDKVFRMTIPLTGEALLNFAFRFSRSSNPHMSEIEYSDISLSEVSSDGLSSDIYVAAPSDDWVNAYPMYYGLSLTPSTKPADYVWAESAEYTRYKSRLDSEEFQLAWNSGQPIIITKISDFKNKVHGSLSDNPHVISTTIVNGSFPPSSGLFQETGTTGYSQVNTLDGILARYGENKDGSKAQVLIKWNLIAQINLDFPGLFNSVGADTLAKQISFAKTAVTRVYPKVFGYGVCPGGNQLFLKVWNTTDWSTSSQQNTTGIIKELSFIRAANNATVFLQNDGYIYLLAYTEASDGITTSNVNLDYASLEYTLSLKNSDFKTGPTTQEYNQLAQRVATLEATK